MSDRALLKELLEYVLSDNYKNLFDHFLDVRKKAKEIRTRMAASSSEFQIVFRNIECAYYQNGFCENMGNRNDDCAQKDCPIAKRIEEEQKDGI